MRKANKGSPKILPIRRAQEESLAPSGLAGTSGPKRACRRVRNVMKKFDKEQFIKV